MIDLSLVTLGVIVVLFLAASPHLFRGGGHRNRH
jgi:hypothetical protein